MRLTLVPPRALYAIVFSLLSPFELAGCASVEATCTPLDKEFATGHARTLYAIGYSIVADRGKNAFKAKRFEALECGSAKGTIYYYEFEDEDAAIAAERSFKTILWGSTTQSSLHTDLVERSFRFVLVASGNEPARLLRHAKKTASEQ